MSSERVTVRIPVEVELVVECRVRGPTPGARRDGARFAEPDDPGEVEVRRAWIEYENAHEGEMIADSLARVFLEEIEDVAAKMAHDAAEAAREDAAESARELRREMEQERTATR